MTTPDPRTDLAGYLGLTDGQAEQCRLFADAEGSISAKLGARLIEQDQARADEPDDGLIAVTEPEPVEGPPGTVPAFIGWNVGEDDPHDHYPWTWTPLLPQDGGPVIGGISTPNGRRPDGSMHTFWSVASDVWEPIGHLICHVVNQWAHEQFGTPVPPAPKPPWKSPLDDLPDLTEGQCDYLAKLAAGYSDDDNDSVLVLVGRALIAAGWSPEEEA